MSARIWIVAKKELKAYFDSPVAYVLLVVFLVASAFFFFRAAFLSGEASLRPFFDLLPWLMLLFAPAVTMRSLSTELKDGTLEVLLTQPLSELELVLGKLLGNVLFMMIGMAGTLLLPITLSFGGSLDKGVLLAQYLGSLFLIIALGSIGIFASALTRNQTVAFIIALAVGFVLLVAGLDFILIMIPAPLNSVFEQIGILNHYLSVARGVVDIRDVIFFLSLSGAFIALAYYAILSRKLSRGAKDRRNLTIGTALILGIAVFANLVSGFTSGRLDLTSEKLYSLSPATKNLVRELKDVVTIKFFSSSELPAQAALLKRDTKDILDDFKDAAKGNIKVQLRSPDTSPEARTEAQALGIAPVQFNVLRQDELQLKQGYIGLSVQYGDKTEAIPFVDQVGDLEYRLVTIVQKLTSESRDKIAFLSGHGEKGIGADIGQLHAQLSERFTVEELNAEQLEGGIGPDVATVIAAGPTHALSEQEDKAIKDYLDAGGSLLLLIDRVTVNPQFMMAEKNESGFSDLLKAFGVSVNRDLIYDIRSNQTISLTQQNLSYVVPYPLWIQAVPSSEALPARDISSVMLPWASSLSLTETKASGTSSVLLSTSRFGGLQSQDYNIAPTDNPLITEENLETRIIAASLSGVGKSQKGRILVVGDSDFVVDSFLQANPENLTFALNAADWLSQDEALIGIRSKNAQPRRLIFSSQVVRGAVRYANLIFLPLMVALGGVVRLARRRRLTRRVYRV